MEYKDFKYHYLDVILYQEIDFTKMPGLKSAMSDDKKTIDKELSKTALHRNFIDDNCMIEYIDEIECILHTNVQIKDVKEV